MSQFSVGHRSMSCWNTITTAYLKILSSAFLKYLLYWTLFACLVQFQGLNLNYLPSEGKNKLLAKLLYVIFFQPGDPYTLSFPVHTPLCPYIALAHTDLLSQVSYLWPNSSCQEKY